MAKRKKASRKTNKLSKLNLSKLHLSKRMIFVLVLALVGSTYFLYQSFAATSTLATLETEAMVQPSGSQVISDNSASAGKATLFKTNGHAAGQVSLASSGHEITVRAKGVQCQGAPTMLVKVGDQQLQSSSVSSTGWTDYTTSSLSLPAGSHTVTVEFSNDHDYTHKNARKNCSRDLYVDRITIFGSVPDAADTSFTLTTTATNVAPGSEVTVNWTAPSGKTSAKDWISIYATTATNQEWQNYGMYQYTDGALSGTKKFIAPTTAGTYEFRYLLNDGYTSVAKSDAITVSTSASTTPPPAPEKITAWRAVGSAPLSDAEAASRVTPRPEIRPANAAANAYKPSASELEAFRTDWRDNYNRTNVDYNPSMAQVTGNFSGTTDEIIQWGAHKWGIPEDWVRAQAVLESWWNHSTRGDQEDNKTSAQMSAYPAYSHIDSDSVYTSLGLMQDKWHPECEWNTSVPCKAGGIEPLRHKSTAFNVDYTLAGIRYYYDGKCYWCENGYTAGQEWESISAHYSPWPWKNPGQLNYINSLKNHLANRTWEKTGF